MQAPVEEPVELKEPDGTTVVYVQHGKDWLSYPPDTPTLKRTIRIEPDTDKPNQSSVGVELATGARQGFGVWWLGNDQRGRAR
jgi:hypothetical protein